MLQINDENHTHSTGSGDLQAVFDSMASTSLCGMSHPQTTPKNGGRRDDRIARVMNYPFRIGDIKW